MIEFETLVRPATPNSALAAPQGLCANAKPDRISPVFAVPPATLFEAFLEAMAALPRANVAAVDRDALQFAATQRSKLLGFIDDVAVRAVPAAGAASGSAPAIYSRSRVGRYDFGVNAKRVATLLDLAAARLDAVR